MGETGLGVGNAGKHVAGVVDATPSCCITDLCVARHSLRSAQPSFDRTYRFRKALVCIAASGSHGSANSGEHAPAKGSKKGMCVGSMVHETKAEHVACQWL